ncbi:MAG: hypothetical protein EXS46_00325 [Candidatus Taylorbacteria bacterium]|nr:hypothetical protein [Candidatus Taylorbacteria bacterium]
MKINEKDVLAILAYLRKRKQGGAEMADIIGSTNPGFDKPVNVAECSRISDVSFFNKNADSIVSASPDADIVLAQVYAASGEYVWVRPGNEELLTDLRWSKLKRIRELQ